jgi:microcystin-dependent protein
VIRPSDFPIGAVLGYGGDASAPIAPAVLGTHGWLLCDGRVLDISDYPALGALLGSRYGGNGTTSFGLPDLRGLFIKGPDSSDRAIASMESHRTALPTQPAFSLSTAGDHNHVVPYLPTDNVSSDLIAGPAQAAWQSGSGPLDVAGAHTHQVMGGDPESRPINLALDFVIRVR